MLKIHWQATPYFRHLSPNQPKDRGKIEVNTHDDNVIAILQFNATAKSLPKLGQ